MRVTIMQPAYLPWQGYFQRIMHSDMCISLDDVKIDWHSKTQFTNRNRVLTPNGPAWLSIPLQKQAAENMRIHNICIAPDPTWQRKHWGTIQQNYSQASFFMEHRDFFHDFFGSPFTMLIDALEQSTTYLLEQLKITVPLVKSSTLDVAGEKSERILNICKKFSATHYISGPFGRTYLDRKAFETAGIEVLFHDFTPLAYPQRSKAFVPYLSLLDLLFSVGAKKSADALQEVHLNDTW